MEGVGRGPGFTGLTLGHRFIPWKAVGRGTVKMGRGWEVRGKKQGSRTVREIFLQVLPTQLQCSVVVASIPLGAGSFPPSQPHLMGPLYYVCGARHQGYCCQYPQLLEPGSVSH